MFECSLDEWQEALRLGFDRDEEEDVNAVNALAQEEEEVEGDFVNILTTQSMGQVGDEAAGSLPAYLSPQEGQYYQDQLLSIHDGQLSQI